ncbi:MAG: hypothetical protein ACI89F_000315, partial [Porticoccaceae bacterium]
KQVLTEFGSQKLIFFCLECNLFPSDDLKNVACVRFFNQKLEAT